MNVQLARIDEIDRLWPHIHAGLGEALKRSGGDMSLGALYAQARTGTVFILVAYDRQIEGAGAFRPETWETGAKLRCLAFYGQDFRAWRDAFMDAVRSLGRLCGTDTAVFEGRVGHEKLFPEAKVLRQLYEVR